MLKNISWRCFDFWLLGAVVLATAFGTTMIRSAVAGNEVLMPLIDRQIYFAFLALLGWLSVGGVFAPLLPPDQIESYIAGLILLAAAPCTAMVFVWGRLTNGDPYFTLSQVALNDTIMIFAFAPIVGLLLGISSIVVPWETLLTSVVLYIVIPVIIAQLWRRPLLARGQAAFDAAMRRIGPWSIGALLLTLVLLFAFQGEAIIRQPLVIALLAVPILIQVFFNSSLAYLLNRAVGEKHKIACPSALIGASNFFELNILAMYTMLWAGMNWRLRHGNDLFSFMKKRRD